MFMQRYQKQCWVLFLLNESEKEVDSNSHLEGVYETWEQAEDAIEVSIIVDGQKRENFKILRKPYYGAE